MVKTGPIEEFHGCGNEWEVFWGKFGGVDFQKRLIRRQQSRVRLIGIVRFEDQEGVNQCPIIMAWAEEFEGNVDGLAGDDMVG